MYLLGFLIFLIHVKAGFGWINKEDHLKESDNFMSDVPIFSSFMQVFSDYSKVTFVFTQSFGHNEYR